MDLITTVFNSEASKAVSVIFSFIAFAFSTYNFTNNLLSNRLNISVTVLQLSPILEDEQKVSIAIINNSDKGLVIENICFSVGKSIVSAHKIPEKHSENTMYRIIKYTTGLPLAIPGINYITGIFVFKGQDLIPQNCISKVTVKTNRGTHRQKVRFPEYSVEISAQI